MRFFRPWVASFLVFCIAQLSLTDVSALAPASRVPFEALSRPQSFLISVFKGPLLDVDLNGPGSLSSSRSSTAMLLFLRQQFQNDAMHFELGDDRTPLFFIHLKAFFYLILARSLSDIEQKYVQDIWDFFRNRLTPENWDRVKALFYAYLRECEDADSVTWQDWLSRFWDSDLKSIDQFVRSHERLLEEVDFSAEDWNEGLLASNGGELLALCLMIWRQANNRVVAWRNLPESFRFQFEQAFLLLKLLDGGQATSFYATQLNLRTYDDSEEALQDVLAILQMVDLDKEPEEVRNFFFRWFMRYWRVVWDVAGPVLDDVSFAQFLGGEEKGPFLRAVKDKLVHLVGIRADKDAQDNRDKIEDIISRLKKKRYLGLVGMDISIALLLVGVINLVLGIISISPALVVLYLLSTLLLTVFYALYYYAPAWLANYHQRFEQLQQEGLSWWKRFVYAPMWLVQAILFLFFAIVCSFILISFAPTISLIPLLVFVCCVVLVPAILLKVCSADYIPMVQLSKARDHLKNWLPTYISDENALVQQYVQAVNRSEVALFHPLIVGWVLPPGQVALNLGTDFTLLPAHFSRGAVAQGDVLGEQLQISNLMAGAEWKTLNERLQAAFQGIQVEVRYEVYDSREGVHLPLLSNRWISPGQAEIVILEDAWRTAPFSLRTRQLKLLNELVQLGLKKAYPAVYVDSVNLELSSLALVKRWDDAAWVQLVRETEDYLSQLGDSVFSRYVDLLKAFDDISDVVAQFDIASGIGPVLGDKRTLFGEAIVALRAA